MTRLTTGEISQSIHFRGLVKESYDKIDLSTAEMVRMANLLLHHLDKVGIDVDEITSTNMCPR